MRVQARKTTRLNPLRALLGAALSLAAIASLAPVAASADVGDQYLPQIPNAGGKKDEYGTEVQTAASAPTTTAASESQAKPEKKPKKKKQVEKPVEKLEVAPVFDSGDGPGTGSVIALALLGVALVGAVLWLVARGRRSLAEAEGPEIRSHHPKTPQGEITGDGSTGEHRRP